MTQLTESQIEAIRRSGKNQHLLPKTPGVTSDDKEVILSLVFAIIVVIPVSYLVVKFGFIVGLLAFGVIRILWFIFKGFFGFLFG